jgi:hypothetical protein
MAKNKPVRRPRLKKRPVQFKGGRSRPRKNYRREEYILALSHAEIGIYQAFEMTDYELTDHDVRRSLNGLIAELREMGYVPAEERDVIEVGGEEPVEDLVIYLIKLNWDDLFDGYPHHSDEDLMGILGVILDSIETWSSPAPDSRGYLWYNVGFQERAGVSIEQISESPEDEALWEEEEETDEEILRELGDDWLDYPDSGHFQAFQRQARKMLDDRQAQEVINVCQYLIGWTNDMDVIEKLVPFLQPAYRQLGVPFRHPGRR